MYALWMLPAFLTSPLLLIKLWPVHTTAYEHILKVCFHHSAVELLILIGSWVVINFLEQQFRQWFQFWKESPVLTLYNNQWVFCHGKCSGRSCLRFAFLILVLELQQRESERGGFFQSCQSVHEDIINSSYFQTTWPRKHSCSPWSEGKTSTRLQPKH